MTPDQPTTAANEAKGDDWIRKASMHITQRYGNVLMVTPAKMIDGVEQIIRAAVPASGAGEAMRQACESVLEALTAYASQTPEQRVSEEWEFTGSIKLLIAALAAAPSAAKGSELTQALELGALLREWLEIHDEPCRKDHHGNCQSHYVQADCIVERTRAALLARQQPAAEGQGWVSVKERLPEETAWLLVYADGAQRTMAWSATNRKWENWDDPPHPAIREDEVTHWKPLPAPPAAATDQQ